MILFSIQSIESFYTNFNAFKQAVQYYKNLRIDDLQNLFFSFSFVNYGEEKIAQISVSSLFLCFMEKCLYINDFLKEPDGYKKLHKHLHKDKFLQAMETEKDNFVSMNTWVEVPESHTIENNKKIILMKWIYKYKLNELKYLKTY